MEYVRFFDLEIEALRGRDVLDVAAGPSSFTAEACARRIDAVAVDPMYRRPLADLTATVESDYARVEADTQARRRQIRVRDCEAVHPDLPDAMVFGSLTEALADRRLSAQRFLADFETHCPHGRYVGAALPFLPFFDRTFDLVLCAHLLFVEAARFDFEWHVAACRELVRVSDGEVRIHPLCGPEGRPYPKLPALRRELRAAGIASEVVAVNYEFFAGADTMLKLRRAPTAA
ncbi:methyltransferase [Opitutus sp. ER46]|nr:methyltransferase [Opitutus sp. ER46]